MADPISHVHEAHQLTADAVVLMFKITLVSGGIIRIKNNNNVTWQGQTFEGVPLTISGLSFTASEEVSRPTLTIANPAGVYSSLVRDRLLERATVLQYRVLYQHIVANTNIFASRTWKIARSPSFNKHSITLELRDQLDGQPFMVPSRFFTPPEFPTVSI